MSPQRKQTGRVTTPKSAPKKVTSASEWKSARGRTLELPSGKVVLAHNPGLDTFIRGGVIPNSLVGIITKAMATGQVPTTIGDPNDLDQIADMVTLIDGVFVRCVLEPKFLLVPENDDDRDPELLYVDEAEFDDRLFIFQWAVGGTHDVELFRKQLTEQLDVVGNVQPVARPTE